MTSDTFLTIAEKSEASFSDKGSKFIAVLFPIKNIDDYKSHIQELKNIHPKARHFCWALRVGKDKNNFKLSDDGEPSGSAGRPILNTLLSAELSNVLAVVVRYFGGTLLGVPGLIHAYKSSTQMAIENAEMITHTMECAFQIQFKYEQMNDAMRIIKEENLQVLKQEFDMICTMVIAIRITQMDSLSARFKNINNLEINYLYDL